jgi:hypothetical protein
MFWSKGDSSKLTDEEKELLARLRRLEETGHISGTTPDQTMTAFAAIRFFGIVVSTGGLLAGARNVGMWVGGSLVAWWAFRDAITTFIKTSAGG